ncbi:hypothetical protein [Sorangium cellulosum]|nr:hypothetical protein [Sorangium cellulosum]
MPYQDMISWFEGEIRGQTGSAIGGGIAGYPGSVRGREIGMGLNVDPWMPKWTPPSVASITGETVGMIGLMAEDGTLLDPVTGEPMDQARAEGAARLLLGGTMDYLGGASGAALDKALGDLSGAGAAALEELPDERLADARDPSLVDGRFGWLEGPFGGSASQTDAAPARTAPAPAPAPARPAAPQPSFLDVLEGMYGGSTVPEPEEPPSIFDASVFGTGAAAPSAPSGATITAAPASPAGSVGATAGPRVVGAQTAPPAGASLGGVVNASRATGAVGSGTLYRQPPSTTLADPRADLWPPTPAGALAELFDAASPDAPRFSRGSARAAAPRRDDEGPDDQGDLERWNIASGVLGAVEGLYETALSTAETMITNTLYLTPIGIPLAVHNASEAAGELARETARNGGGVLDLLEAVNERYNPLVGLVRNTVEAVEAYEDRDARKLGNRTFKLGFELLGMAAILRGGKQGGTSNAAARRTASHGQGVHSRINLAAGRTRTTPLRTTGEPISAGWDHILDQHFNRPVANNRSAFSISPAELRELLQSDRIINSPVKPVAVGKDMIFERTVDTGRTVGQSSLNRGGVQTSTIRVYTDRAGNIVTAFPY